MIAVTDTEFHRLEKDVQEHIRLHLAVCERIAAHPAGVIAGCAHEAKANPFYKGMSASSIMRRYYAYMKDGDWRVFAPKAKLRSIATHLPQVFIDYWHSICLANKRKIRPAWRQLVQNWSNGEHVPGFGTWRDYWGEVLGHDQLPDKCPPDLPRGWTYETLNRLRPAVAELQLVRFGIAATRSILPHVIGTRDGMRPMEYVVFDDVELDFLTLVPGVERPCKIRAIVCKDVATDVWLRFVLRPALVREDGKQDGLKLRDMKRLCLELVTNFGYPKDFVSNWIVERGTATLPEAEILALAELSGGMIKVHETSMISGKVLLGGYADKSVGNSWGKAWIESGFNLLHNELADLPGQKGRRYDLAPAELEARKKAATQLIRAGQALPPDLRLMLRLPFLDIYQAQEQLTSALMRINVMEGHNCEGFKQIIKWRMDPGDQWKTEDRLLDLHPSMMDKIETKAFLETRMERWARLIKGVHLEKMAEEFAPRWMDDHRKVTVQKYQIKLQVEGQTHTYFHRDSALLYEGAEYLAYYNPFDLDHIYLTNAAGAYRGSLPRVKAIRRDDQEALERRLADCKHTLNQQIASVRAKTTAHTEQAIEDMEHNIGLFQDAPSTPIIDLTAAIAARDAARAKDKARREASRELDAATLLDEPAANPDQHEPTTMDASILL